MTAVDIGSYVRQLRRDGHTGAVEFGVPIMHSDGEQLRATAGRAVGLARLTTQAARGTRTGGARLQLHPY